MAGDEVKVPRPLRPLRVNLLVLMSLADHWESTC